jgi:hypothetical protein
MSRERTHHASARYFRNRDASPSSRREREQDQRNSRVYGDREREEYNRETNCDAGGPDVRGEFYSYTAVQQHKNCCGTLSFQFVEVAELKIGGQKETFGLYKRVNRPQPEAETSGNPASEPAPVKQSMYDDPAVEDNEKFWAQFPAFAPPPPPPPPQAAAPKPAVDKPVAAAASTFFNLKDFANRPYSATGFSAEFQDLLCDEKHARIRSFAEFDSDDEEDPKSTDNTQSTPPPPPLPPAQQPNPNPASAGLEKARAFARSLRLSNGERALIDEFIMSADKKKLLAACNNCIRFGAHGTTVNLDEA